MEVNQITGRPLTKAEALQAVIDADFADMESRINPGKAALWSIALATPMWAAIYYAAKAIFKF